MVERVRRGPGRRSARGRRPSSTAASSSREGVEDEDDNVTRFVWIAPRGTEPAARAPWKTSLVFSELGEDHPGALVDALREFSDRGINLTRIESRPLRQGLGRYMFFCDLEGRETDAAVAEAIAAAAHQGRVGADPRLLPGRLSGRLTRRIGRRLPTISGQHGTGSGTQRDV